MDPISTPNGPEGHPGPSEHRVLPRFLGVTFATPQRNSLESGGNHAPPARNALFRKKERPSRTKHHIRSPTGAQMGARRPRAPEIPGESFQSHAFCIVIWKSPSPLSHEPTFFGSRPSKNGTSTAEGQRCSAEVRIFTY